VSHLKRPQGDKGHEGGEKVYLSHLRGSAAIAQLSDSVISISRDMSSGEQQIHVACLKNRYAGITGDMGTLEYNPETGRLTEVIDEFS
jgi:twinkle protein